jgi:hypothetical protein
MIAVAFLVVWWMIALGYSATWSRMWQYAWLIALGLLGACTINNYLTTWYPRRYVCEDTIVRVGPNETYGSCGSVTSHSEIVIYQTQHDWSKIGFRSLVGWIPSHAIAPEGQYEG